MNNDVKKWGVIIVVMFAGFILFREYYQKGKYLLRDYHPWDWIGLIVILGLLVYALYKIQIRHHK